MDDEQNNNPTLTPGQITQPSPPSPNPSPSQTVEPVQPAEPAVVAQPVSLPAEPVMPEPSSLQTEPVIQPATVAPEATPQAIASVPAVSPANVQPEIVEPVTQPIQQTAPPVEPQTVNQQPLQPQPIQQQPVQSTAPPPVQPVQQSPKNGRKLLPIILAVVGGVVLLGGIAGGVLFWINHNSPEKIFSDMLDNNLRQETIVQTLESEIDANNSYEMSMSADLVKKKTAMQGTFSASISQSGATILMKAEVREVDGKNYFNLNSMQLQGVDSITQAQFQSSLSNVVNKWAVSDTASPSIELEDSYGLISPWAINASEPNSGVRGDLVAAMDDNKVFDAKVDEEASESGTLVYDVVTSKKAFQAFLDDEDIEDQVTDANNPFDSMGEDKLEMRFFVDRDTRTLKKVTIEGISDPLGLTQTISGTQTALATKDDVSLDITFLYDKSITVEAPAGAVPESELGI